MWQETRLLLLHHTGAKSGASRVNPVAYLPDDRRYLIWAANGGAPKHPDWFHNLKAQPNTRIEVGSETIDVVAEEATGAERERLFARPSENTERSRFLVGGRFRGTVSCVRLWWCQAVLAIQWLWSLRRLWVAATNRHSDCAAALPLRMNRSIRRLYLICP